MTTADLERRVTRLEATQGNVAEQIEVELSEEAKDILRAALTKYDRHHVA